MKYFLILITIMLVGGCGKDKEAQTKTKVTEDNNATKPVKELTLRGKVIGTYEIILLDPKGFAVRAIFLDNGIVENYNNGKKVEVEFKWEITKEGELLLTHLGSDRYIYSINKNKSITNIAIIDKDGEREDVKKEEQMTFKKIK